MKDAKGHGSDPRGAAHQQGVESALPKGVREIPLKDIYRWQDVNPENVAYIRGLMQRGIQLKPIDVVEKPDRLPGRDAFYDNFTSPNAKYTIRDGSHRLEAARLEGLKTIRARVR